MVVGGKVLDSYCCSKKRRFARGGGFVSRTIGPCEEQL